MVAHDDSDDQSHQRVQPVEAAGQQDDRAADSYADGSGRIGHGVEHDRLHAEITGYIPQDDRAGDHGSGRHNTDDHHRQPLDGRGAGAQPANGLHSHRYGDEQQEARVGQSRKRGRPGVSVWVTAHAQCRQAEPGAERIAEIVGAGGQHTQRVGEQSDYQQAQDHCEIDAQHQAEARVLRHEASMRWAEGRGQWDPAPSEPQGVDDALITADRKLIR